MQRHFRISFGTGSCSGSRRNATLTGLCAEIRARLDRYAVLSQAQIDAVDEQTEELRIAGKRAELTLFRQVIDAGTLLVVQGYVPTFWFPTFIGSGGIGHVLAEGIVIDAEGQISPAPDHLMWEYR
jgi:hypothetical protein